MPRNPIYHPLDHIKLICEWIGEGKTLRDYCRQPNTPSYGTVYDWIEVGEGKRELFGKYSKEEARKVNEALEEFASHFARARLRGEEQLALECLEIADDATNDWMERLDSDNQPVGWKLNGDHVQRSKLRIETRLKLLAKFNPKKWGEKIDHTSTDGSMSPVKSIEGFTLVPLTNK